MTVYSAVSPHVDAAVQSIVEPCNITIFALPKPISALDISCIV